MASITELAPNVSRGTTTALDNPFGLSNVINSSNVTEVVSNVHKAAPFESNMLIIFFFFLMLCGALLFAYIAFKIFSHSSSETDL